MQQLFAEVLVLCHRLGLGQVGMVALDGTKIAAPASPDVNRTEEGLRKAAQAEEQRQASGRRPGIRHGMLQPGTLPKMPRRMPASATGWVMRCLRSRRPTATAPGRVRRVGGRRGRVGSRRRWPIWRRSGNRLARRGWSGQRRQARVDAKGGRPVDGRPPAGSEIMLAAQALATRT